jgi:hypothetical protein
MQKMSNCASGYILENPTMESFSEIIIQKKMSYNFVTIRKYANKTIYLVKYITPNSLKCNRTRLESKKGQ